LRILKNCELVCEGITTPGGFGNLVKSELSLAVQQAVREVFAAEVPHYFKYVSGGKESTQPKLEHVRGGGGDRPSLTVNVPAGTGDWFGDWDGDRPCEAHRYANQDASAGRMVELIERGDPAVMLCHWPGLYTHGTRRGFEEFKKVILALEGRFRDRTLWMKSSELARYWAAKELTQIERRGNDLTLRAPLAAPRFTLRVPGVASGKLKFVHEGEPVVFGEVRHTRALVSGSWFQDMGAVLLCFDLPRGISTLSLPIVEKKASRG
jgi:hypothetical protein